ncbi:MAG: copper transport protein [Thermomicrobiales bacterium]|nr:copper transport protein [Thermomicrobiales bacterium]
MFRGFCLAVVLAFAFGILLQLLWTPSADAHARLVASTPAAGSALSVTPAELRLDFSEQVDARFSRADLLKSDGSAVPIAAIETDAADRKIVKVVLLNAAGLPDGTYVLVWRVLSAVDGHVTSGTLPFSVGTGQLPTGIVSLEASGRPPWWRIAARWLELIALLAVVGGFTFGALVARAAWQVPGYGFAIQSWWSRSWWYSAIALALSLGFALVDQGLIATGASLSDPPPLSVYRQLVFDSTFGTAWLARIACLCCLAAVARIVRSRSGSSGRTWGAGIAFGAAMLLSVPFAGHAAGEPNRVLAVATDWFHLAAAAVWLGGLVYLLASLVALRRCEDGDAGALAAKLVGRFSILALATVAVLLATGLGNTAFHVTGPRALRDQDYGIALLAKHAVVALVLIAAAVNLLVNKPRLQVWARLGEVDAIRRQLRTTELVVAVELVFGLTIIVAAAALTELPPADAPLAVDVAAKEVIVDQRAEAEDLRFWLLGRLRGSTDDRFTVNLTAADGDAPAAIQRVIVEASATPKDGGESTAVDRFDAQPLAGSPGSFVFPAVRLGLRATWTVTVIVRRAGLEDVRASLSVDTREAGVPPPRAAADAWRLPRFPLAAWALMALATIIAIGGVVGVKRLPGLEPLAAALILTMIGLIAAGFAVSAARQTVPVTDDTGLANPMSADAGSVQRGAPIYAANCLACHGPAGAGVTSADPEHGHGAAADLTDRRSRGQRDGDLYHAITNGIPGSAMPAYDWALTDEERWDVVNYLRQLQNDADR